MTGSVRQPPAWRHWTLGVGAAEAGGIAVAAGSAGLALAIVGEPQDALDVLVVLTAAVLGGVVEGMLVGTVMHRMLSGWLPLLPQRPFVLATAAVAASGWLLGSLPSAVMSAVDPAASTGAPAPEPSLLLVAAVFAAGGAVAGLAFGGAQALVLRHHVARPWRWVAANAVGWAFGVSMITVGASVVPGGWPVAGLAAYGAVVGLLAGLVVGAVTGCVLPYLEDTGPRAVHWRDRTVLVVLRGPAHRLLSGSLAELRYTGPRSGLVHALPVQYVQDDGVLVLLVGHSEDKTWWRVLRRTRHVDALVAGRWWPGEAVVLEPGEPGFLPARRLWHQRFPRAHLRVTDPVVVVHLDRHADTAATDLPSAAPLREWTRPGAGEHR